MNAVVLYGPGKIEVKEVPNVEPNENEVLIKVKNCGVCGTDISLFNGNYPANYPVIIGHEFSGEVAQIGKNVSNINVGERVTVDPNFVCHSCFFCRIGKEHLCNNLSSMGVHCDGANAEYCVVNQSNVYKFPENLSFEEAAFTEPLACALHGSDLANIKMGDTVLVIGGGSMGNLITQCARLQGAANIIVSEPISERRKKALENGATSCLDPSKQDVEAEVMMINPNGADVVFEVAGNSEAQTMCISMVRKGGTIVYFGCSPKDHLIKINPFIINENELKILGSFNNQFSTSRAIELLSKRKIKVENLITNRLALEDYMRVFKIIDNKNTLKIMVYMN
jgi:2-desacetyl-2-hydroxyethyl bacteriochlorophyllide A dehydrogenase